MNPHVYQKSGPTVVPARLTDFLNLKWWRRKRQSGALTWTTNAQWDITHLPRPTLRDADEPFIQHKAVIHAHQLMMPFRLDVRDPEVTRPASGCPNPATDSPPQSLTTPRNGWWLAVLVYGATTSIAFACCTHVLRCYTHNQEFGQEMCRKCGVAH